MFLYRKHFSQCEKKKSTLNLVSAYDVQEAEKGTLLLLFFEKYINSLLSRSLTNNSYFFVKFVTII